MTAVELPCPGGCGRTAPAQRYGCPGCWHRLPFPIRRRITNSWRLRLAGDHRGKDRHEAAKAEAAEWFAGNPVVTL